MNYLVKIIAALAIGVAAVPALADTLIDTRPADGTYFDYPYLYSAQWEATAFNVTAATTITSIQGYLIAREAGMTLTTRIYAGDASEYLPGTPMGAASFTVGSTDAGLYGADNLSIALNPGLYWVAFEVDPGQTFNGYAPATAGDGQGAFAYYSPYNPGYRHDTRLGELGVVINAAAPVPEPGEWALMTAGLSVTAMFARRRRSTRGDREAARG